MAYPHDINNQTMANQTTERSPQPQDDGWNVSDVIADIVSMADTSEEMDDELSDEVLITTEELGRRQRRISAEIWLPQSIEHIWQVLTDYDHLADFIPNLDQSHRLKDVDSDTTRIEQIGAECFLTFKFCARVILDMVESFPNRIEFSMVEGDFRSFAGSWNLQPETVAGENGTQLRYIVDVEPNRWMPIGLIERHLKKNLSANMVAIRNHVTNA
jgi:ribosome-associated toxin RatA of RatAB toxin-antitoxin module